MKYKRNLGISKFFSNNPILTIPIGIVGCGKTTNTPKDHLSISKDKIRFMLLNTILSLIYFEEELEPTIDFFQRSFFNKLIELKANIYIDSTNLTWEKRKYFVKKAFNANYSIQYFLFSDFERAKRFNQKRERSVPNDVINDMIKQFEPPSTLELEKYLIKLIVK